MYLLYLRVLRLNTIFIGNLNAAKSYDLAYNLSIMTELVHLHCFFPNIYNKTSHFHAIFH